MRPALHNSRSWSALNGIKVYVPARGCCSGRDRVSIQEVAFILILLLVEWVLVTHYHRDAYEMSPHVRMELIIARLIATLSKL